MAHEQVVQLRMEQRLRRACAELNRRLRAGQEWRAEDAMAKFPELSSDSERALELIYAEFVIREELGQGPAAAEYFERFPKWRDRLKRQFEIHDIVNADDSRAERTIPGEGLVADENGERIGDYVVIKCVTRGGMGVVYKAQHVELKRTVALKVLRAAAKPSGIAARRSEARLVAQLQHPNIVQLFESGVTDTGTEYLVFEWVEGGSLAEKLSGSLPTVRSAAELVETLAGAIHYAHRQGVVHCDLKPANVVITQEGVPRIADFGLGNYLQADPTNQTQTGVQGTPSYMAPEQLDRESKPSAAVDIYALGAILYELLTGRPPLLAETPLATMHLVRSTEPLEPRRLQPGIPRDLATICMKCLQKPPGKRYSSAKALAEDLRRFAAGEPIKARDIGIGERAWKWFQRRPAAAALVALSVIMPLVLVVAGVLYVTRLKAAHDEAEANRIKAERSQKLAEDQLASQRRSAYAVRLSRVSMMWQKDPQHGLELLTDQQRCPHELREFAWRLLYQLCRRDRRVYVGDDKGVAAVAYSPDGGLLASGGWNDGTVRLWNTTTGGIAATLANGTPGVRSVAFSPDGQLLAISDANGTVRLWIVSAPQLVATLEHSKHPVQAITFSSDAQYLAAAVGGRVSIWNVAERERETRLNCRSYVRGLAYSPDGRYFATAGSDGVVRLWSTEKYTERERVSLAEQIGGGPANTLAFSPDSKTLAIGAHAQGTILYNVENQRQVSFDAESHRVSSVEFSPDGTLLVSGGGRGEAILWDVEHRTQHSRFRSHRRGVHAAVFSPDGATLATSSIKDNTIREWDVIAAPNPVLLREGFEQQIKELALAPDGITVALATFGPVIHVCDAKTGHTRLRLASHKEPIEDLAYSHDGKLLASAGADASVRIWNAETGQQTSLLPHDAEVMAVAFSPDSRSLASASRDGKLTLWNVADWTKMWDVSADRFAWCLAFGPNGSRLATGHDGGDVRLWTAADGTELAVREAHKEDVMALNFSPDGRLLASGGEEETVKLWEAEQLDEIASLRGHTYVVVSAAFSPDSRTLATGSGSQSGPIRGEVILWDTTSGQPLATLPGAIGPVVFSSEGSRLVTGDQKRGIQVWKAWPRTEP